MSETERQDAAATRRRWVTLAEVVAVSGVVIAGLSLYNGWDERRGAAAEKEAARVAETRTKTLITLEGVVEEDGRRLLLKDPEHPIQRIDVRFATPLALPARDAVPTPRIEADWFADGLLKLTDGGADEREGRMPVLITSGYWDGDAFRTAVGLYDVIWRTEGRMLRGRTLRIEGITLRLRNATVAQLDSAWMREKPAR